MWLNSLFIAVLNMSLTGGIATLIVILARVVMKKAPKLFSYAIWAIVLFRLLCPVSLTSNFSLLGVMNLPVADNGNMEYIPYRIHNEQNKTGIVELPVENASNSDRVLNQHVITTLDSFQIHMFIVAFIWIFVIIILVLYNGNQYLKLRHQLIGGSPLFKNVYLVDHIDSAFVLGLLCPKIYLPSTLTEKERGYILKHEKYHISRGDHIIKLLAFTALCIHWFNPLVWIAFSLLRKDMEMSCDEAVIKNLNSDIRSDYAQSLLFLSSRKKNMANFPISFGKEDVKNRIKNILNYKNPTFGVTIFSLMALIIVTISLLTNPLHSIKTTNYEDTINSEATILVNDEIVTDNTGNTISLPVSSHENTNLLTLDNLMRMCEKDTWKEDVQTKGLSLFTPYSNIIQNEIVGTNESLTNFYYCSLTYNQKKYELQIYYWLPETAQEYGYERNEIDSIGIFDITTGDGQLLYMTPKENGFYPNTDILSFLSKDYGLEQYLTYTLPEGEKLGDFRVGIVDHFDGALFDRTVTDIHGNSIPTFFNASGGLLVCTTDDVEFIFTDGTITHVQGVQINHMEIIEKGESYRTEDFSVYLVKTAFDLFTASELEEYETVNNVKLTVQDTTSRYWYAYMGKEGSSQKYLAFLNADLYSKADMLNFINQIRLVN